MRNLPALIAAAAVLVGLSACASSTAGTTSTAGCDAPYASGASSSLIKAAGAVGSAPTVSFPTPLVSAGDQVSTITTGTGRVIEHGDVVDFDATILIGSSGTTAGATAYTAGQPAARQVADDKGGVLAKALQCTRVGSRVALTTSAETLYGASQLPQGITAGATLVVVIDVEAGYLGKANGTPEPGVNGLPAVVRTPDTGEPGLSIPAQDPPKKRTKATVLAGSGPVVREGQRVVLNLTAVDWQTKAVVANTWDERQPRTVELTTGSGAQLPAGFVDAVVGSRVGSQIMVVVPPGADAQVGGQLPSGVGEKDSTIYVADVLGVVQ